MYNLFVSIKLKMESYSLTLKMLCWWALWFKLKGVPQQTKLWILGVDWMVIVEYQKRFAKEKISAFYPRQNSKHIWIKTPWSQIYCTLFPMKGNLNIHLCKSLKHYTVQCLPKGDVNPCQLHWNNRKTKIRSHSIPEEEW